VDLGVFRALRESRAKESQLKEELRQVDKTTLLAELLHYNTRYTKAPGDITLTLRMKAVMDILEERAELEQLRDLSREFHAKLDRRLKSQLASAMAVNR